ncbi:Fic family protein [Anaerostipes faecis]|uniref:Fic family protein n=1 Tax=Anaerostipes faecis TaxID=2880702 RepID=UPI00265ADC40|nr:Fic family protein [Anaerostipes faecis]
MIPYTGDYIEHIDSNQNNFKYYTFTPRPLMHGDMYKIDDELSTLLIEAHRNIGFLDGLLKYAPNKSAFSELMLLKECTYSRMIDYDGPSFQDVLVSRGSGKGDITSITNIELAYKKARDRIISAPVLSELCGVALHGDVTDKTVDVRDKQTFLLGVRTNLKTYTPTAPDAVLPALADISAYLYNDKDTDPLIKVALVHYQFEMIHPFERYNGVIGRIIVPMILCDIVREAKPLICLSEYLYHNKNEYFDLLRTTQYSGGYIRLIKFFVNAIGETAKRSARLFMRYENAIAEDEKMLDNIKSQAKSVRRVYNNFKRFPLSSTVYAKEQTGLSFNTVSKAFGILKSMDIIEQQENNTRNRIWKSLKLALALDESKV